MSGGGGTTTTVQSTNSDPWSGVQPTLSKANTIALNDVSADTFKPSDTKTYVDQSADTLSSLDMMRNQANAGVVGLPQAQQQALGVINKGGVDSALTGQYGDLRGNVADYASGNMIGANNANLMKSLESSADKMAQSVNESAAGMGRYGSATHQGALSDSIGQMYSNALANQYNQDVDAMMQANNLSGSILGQQIGSEMQGDSLAMQAGQGLGALYETGLAPASTLGQIGSAVEEQNRMELQDTLDKESANKNASMNYANWLNSIGAGAGQFGTTTQTAQQPSQPWWQTTAGLGLTGLGLLSGW